MATEDQVEAPTVATLTGYQLEAFKTLLKNCQDRGLTQRQQEQPPGDVCDGINDDATLMRFLQGRNFDPEGALVQFEEAMAIRKENQAIEAYDTISVADFEQARKIYPHWSGCRDKLGLPICMFDIALLDSETIAKYNSSHSAANRTQHAVVFHDYLTRFFIPLCVAIPDCKVQSPSVTSAVYLANASSMGIKQAWSLRGYAQAISHLLAVCFPEVVDCCYVLNAPVYFERIWGLLSKFVDPRTASKLVIVPSGSTLSTLTVRMGIESIPTEYGGKFEYQPGMPPRLDQDILEHFEWALPGGRLPEGPIKWVESQDEGRVLLTTGSVDGKGRNEVLRSTKKV
ncbi:CRAL-TRIO domain-containing protein [Fusarium tricinctum]|uniref:CRAL-TRIO domain-containing protein n=1 Tax=Fusarium tricinctum TaxID=61284 RepID=A0A8K0S9R0_9HYPO|nr:CRAL-TRIO domain-containing protein [Fusarium tricinctum]